MKPRKAYARDEAAVRGAWLASVGADDEGTIAARAHCHLSVAFRVAVLRRGGAHRTVTLWLDGLLTLRQLERIVLAAPFDEDAQLDEARATSPLARSRLERGAA